MSNSIQSELIRLAKEVNAYKQAYPYIVHLFPESKTVSNPNIPSGQRPEYNTFRVTYEDSMAPLLSYVFPSGAAVFSNPTGNTQLVRIDARSGNTTLNRQLTVFSTRKIIKIEQIA